MQRLRVGLVDNEIGINGKDLNGFVREVLAPVTDAWAFGQRQNLVANRRFNAISSLLSFLM